MQGIATQILNETPSNQTAPVSANSEHQTADNTNPVQKTDDFDHRFSVLAKMERKLKEQEGQFKNRSREWEEKDKKLSEYEELIKLMDENPLEAIKRKKGWGLQEINEFAVKNSNDDDLDPVARITRDYEAKIAAIEEKLTKQMEEKLKAKEEEIVGKDHERQVVEFKAGIKTFLAENKDQFEFIHAEEGGHEAVFELIYEDVMRQQAKIKEQEENGETPDEIRIMDIKDAAEKIENFLDNRYSKYLSLNKVKSKFQPSDDKFGKFITQSEPPKTLNSSFSPKSKSVDQLSEQERRQAAIDHIRSQRQ